MSLRQFRDIAAAKGQPEPCIVRLSVTTPLVCCVLVDKPLWDLSQPRAAAAERYAFEIAEDLGLAWPAAVAFARKLKDAIDRARQEVAAGTLRGHLANVEQQRSTTPFLQRIPREKLEALRQAQQSHAAAEAAAAAPAPATAREAGASHQMASLEHGPTPGAQDASPTPASLGLPNQH